MRQWRQWRQWQKWAAPFLAATAATALSSVSSASSASQSIEVLHPVDALPAHICGQFREPTAFVQATAGHYLVMDRRAHTVSVINKQRTSLTTLLKVGMEKGAVLQPGALSLSSEGTFAVSDAPFSQERVQVFFDDGTAYTAFLLPGVAAPRLTIGSVILSGAGSMYFTGRTLLMNVPESGALVSEFNLEGHLIRRIGTLRPTGHESDVQVHRALNVGLALGTSDGGLIFVFQTGKPMFRKYAADGRLEFERHIEGAVLDDYIQTLPTTWPVRKAGDGTYPLVPPVVRTAAISPDGDLWVSLSFPFTYVYNAAGEKTRTVQLNGTGAFSPTSMAFSRASGSPRLLAMPGCFEFPVTG
jgi:hypothetical protein